MLSQQRDVLELGIMLVPLFNANSIEGRKTRRFYTHSRPFI